MVYLLCFDTKLKHAKHYIGFVNNAEGLDARMKKHRNGSGSKLMAAVAKAGIEFTIARLWANADRSFERKLKNHNNSKRFCPICNGSVKPMLGIVCDTETSGLDPLNSLTLTGSLTLEILQDSLAVPNPLSHNIALINFKP
jgi:hypothetical protein